MKIINNSEILKLNTEKIANVLLSVNEHNYKLGRHLNKHGKKI